MTRVLVVEDAAALSDGQMQALARQFNLSETTFLVAPEDGADAGVRIFTASHEMPFAGHPTLGTAHVARSLGLGGDRLGLSMPAGVIPVAADGDTWTLTANRGVVEFIEVLKLDVAFLYDLLGASQEHMIKPKKFAQTYIDEVILGHTNEPEYKKLQGNEMMEAFRDRTIKIDVPYNIRLDDEIKIYMKDFAPDKIKGIHIAPHTIEVAAMWAVMTRLADPKKAGITKLQKLKLYNGKSIPGFTED